MDNPAGPAPLVIPEELEKRIGARMLDVLIRAALLFALAAICYQTFAPFLTLGAWSLILAVAMFPLHQRLARRLRDKQGLTAAIIVLLLILIILVPTALLLNSLGDSIRGLVKGVEEGTLKIPQPRESMKKWPLIGEKVHDYWTRANADLPAFVLSLQPKVGELAKSALGIVANIGGGLLMFLAALVVSGIILAYGRPAAVAIRAVCVRIAGPERGEQIATRSAATIRTVAQGVIGVAFIQAILIGLGLLMAGVPWAGLLSVIALVFAVAQIPTFLVTIPAIAYLWMSGHYTTGPAIGYTTILVIAGLIDNVLKPFMMKGGGAPMPVVLLGALGGMATHGILGMFVGSTVLALGYQLFTGWVGSSSPPPTAT
jgi:predicted PurR-regulated permease PerM